MWCVPAVDRLQAAPDEVIKSCWIAFYYKRILETSAAAKSLISYSVAESETELAGRQ